MGWTFFNLGRTSDDGDIFIEFMVGGGSPSAQERIYGGFFGGCRGSPLIGWELSLGSSSQNSQGSNTTQPNKLDRNFKWANESKFSLGRLDDKLR